MMGIFWSRMRFRVVVRSTDALSKQKMVFVVGSCFVFVVVGAKNCERGSSLNFFCWRRVKTPSRFSLNHQRGEIMTEELYTRGAAPGTSCCR